MRLLSKKNVLLGAAEVGEGPPEIHHGYEACSKMANEVGWLQFLTLRVVERRYVHDVAMAENIKGKHSMWHLFSERENFKTSFSGYFTHNCPGFSGEGTNPSP